MRKMKTKKITLKMIICNYFKNVKRLIINPYSIKLQKTDNIQNWLLRISE